LVLQIIPLQLAVAAGLRAHIAREGRGRKNDYNDADEPRGEFPEPRFIRCLRRRLLTMTLTCFKVFHNEKIAEKAATQNTTLGSPSVTTDEKCARATRAITVRPHQPRNARVAL